MESFEYWPRLPEELKREVIKNMGFADRYNTRLCASQEMRLVDKLPTHLDNLEFVVKSDEAFRQHYISLAVDKIPFKNIVDLRTNSRFGFEKFSIQNFCRVFENKNSTVQRLDLQLFYQSTNRSIFDLLVAEIQKREIKIWVKEVHLDCSEERKFSWRRVAKLMTIFRNNHPSQLFLRNLREEDYIKIYKLAFQGVPDQTIISTVPKLYELHLKWTTPFISDQYLFRGCSPGFAWSQLKHYKAHGWKPVGSVFKFRTIVEMDIDGIMQLYDVQPQFRKFQHVPDWEYDISEFPDKELQMFDTDIPEKVFICELLPTYIAGVICQRDQLIFQS